MNKLTKIMVIVLVLLIVGFCLLNYRDKRRYRCAICQSTEIICHWRLGIWAGPSVPLTRKTSRIRESHIYTDFYDAGHQHEWQFATGSPFYLFGTLCQGSSVGRGCMSNELFFHYSDPIFRDYIRSEIEGGRLSPDELRKLFALNKYFEKDPLQDKLQQIIDGYASYAAQLDPGDK